MFNMGIFYFLSILKATVCKILSLCSLAWNPFFWYKITCRFVLQFCEEIMSALSFGQVSSTKENPQRASLNQDKILSDDDELREELRYISTSSHSSQYRFEEKLQKLESDLSEEKNLWQRRYQELLVDQQALREQEKYLEESLASPSVDVIDGFTELNIDIRDGLHRRSGNHVTTSVHDYNSLPLLDGLTSLQRPPLNHSFPVPSAPVFFAGSTSGRKAQKCFRVFAPRSPFDLTIGKRIKVILPSGRLAIGTVSKLGQLPGKVECQVGVDLEPPECWQQEGVYKTQQRLHSDPSSAIIVPFSKVLMVWE